jgi:phosphatidylglycerol lysyltransferase
MRARGSQAGIGQEPPLDWRRLGARALASLLAAVGFLWLLLQRLQHIDLEALAAGFASVPLLHWGAAMLATALSFWALGHYDAVVHRATGSTAPQKAARRAGICAIAVSQTLGLGLLSGAILRWRMLPETSFWQATRLTALVAVSFLAGWAFITALTLALLTNAPFHGMGLVLLPPLVLTALLCLWPPKRLRGLPNSFTLLRLVSLTAVDTFAAAAALWLLCPLGMDLPFLTLLPAFLLAFGAGLISGAPGGVGPFEIALLALLPAQPEAELIAAVLAWRACYYALPALIGAGFALRGVRTHPASPPLAAGQLLSHSARAEHGLALQGAHHLLAIAPNSGLLVAQTRHFLIALFDPISGPSRRDIVPCLSGLKQSATAADRSAVLYKFSARSTAIARAQGHCVLRIAKEAVVVPGDYHLDSPARAGLRRKLRHAAAAGVCLRSPTAPRNYAELGAIAAQWATAHGAERGFSMGRYSPHYLEHQRLYIAEREGRAMAFVSFHVAAQEWTLDLMRHGPDLPDGTMHLLIQSAIEEAKAQGLARLSLAAVPENHLRLPWAQRLFDQGHGLHRFKSSFAPRWQPLYMAAANPVALLLSGAEIALAVHHPPDLNSTNALSQNSADIEFASAPRLWQTGGNRNLMR